MLKDAIDNPAKSDKIVSEVTRMATKAQARANAKYNATHTTGIHLKLNLKTDADVIERLNEVPSKQGYIKALIRADIRKEQG